MKVILLRFDSNRKVIGEWEQEQDQAHPGPKLGVPYIGLEDFTSHPDGPEFIGRTQLPDGSFTPIISPPKSRRQELKDTLKTRPWTQAERDEVLAFTL